MLLLPPDLKKGFGMLEVLGCSALWFNRWRLLTKGDLLVKKSGEDVRSSIGDSGSLST